MNKPSHNEFHTRIVTRVMTSIVVNVVCSSNFPLIALANTNIQHKQINYDADNIDKNKNKE